MKKDITKLFCFVDDFSNAVEQWLNKKSIEGNSKKSPTRVSGMRISEIMAIILLYHQSPCKNFKYFYNSYLQLYKKDFPNLLSYNRFIELQKRVLLHITMLFEWYCHQAKMTGVSYIDSTSIAVSLKEYQEIKHLLVLQKLAKLPKVGFTV